MELKNAEFIAAYGSYDSLPEPERIEIVFSGRSNVGKSSLINRIFQRKALARVSSTPGKTRTINYYGCGNLHFVDLPGYGYAKVSKSEKLRWQELVGGYFADGKRDIGLVLQLVDIRRSPTEDDLTMIDFLIENELPFLIVLTKADKLNKSERQRRMEEIKSELPCFDQLTVVPFSALTGEGADELRSIIAEISDQE